LFFLLPCSYSVPGIQRRGHQQRDPEAAREGAGHRGGGAPGRVFGRDPVSLQPVSVQLLPLVAGLGLRAVAGHPRRPDQRPARQLQQRGTETTGGEGRRPRTAERRLLYGSCPVDQRPPAFATDNIITDRPSQCGRRKYDIKMTRTA